MKSKEQVLRYVSQCEFQDGDWQKVLNYCRKNFGGGKAHRAAKPLPNSQSTYEDFIEWIDNGIGVGDVVKYGRTVGIVGAYTTGYAKLSVYLSLDGDLIDNDMEVPRENIYLADNDGISLMQNKLLENAFEFSVSLSRCVKMYQPKGGDIVRVTYGDSQTTGIFRSCDGCVNYFYVYIEGDKIAQDKEFAISDIHLSLPTKRDTQRLLMVLAKNNLEWSARSCTLRSVAMSRVVKNERYWYVGDRFSVCSDIDKYTKLHDERCKSGNYFMSYQAAVLFVQKIQELRKEMAGEV